MGYAVIQILVGKYILHRCTDYVQNINLIIQILGRYTLNRKKYSHYSFFLVGFHLGNVKKCT